MDTFTTPVYSIVISTIEHTLTLFLNNEFYKSYPIAVGKLKTPTPKGRFQVANKFINPGGPFGARWMGLSKNGNHYGIHGTNNPDSIGKNASHGCIRLQNKDVIELYDIISIGTMVEII